MRLIGNIDKDMLGCVRVTFSSDIVHVLVNSGGGGAREGKAIAYLLARNNIDLTIEQYCLSSCGNYFVPVAKSVRLLPGAFVGLHGTPDPQMLDLSDLETHIKLLELNDSPSLVGARRNLEMRRAKTAIILESENRFASDFDVPLGWRHYRDIDEPADGWRRHFVPGSDKGVLPRGFMIVEEPMLRSCLPNVTAVDFQSGLENSLFVNNRYFAFIEKRFNAYRSHGLSCIARS